MYVIQPHAEFSSIFNCEYIIHSLAGLRYFRHGGLWKCLESEVSDTLIFILYLGHVTCSAIYNHGFLQ